VGIKWSLSAFIATIVLVLIGGAIFNKAKSKKNSPIFKVIAKIKGLKNDEKEINSPDYYRRLSHKGGIKW